MANGYLSATDIRSNPNYMDAVVGAIGSRIGKASDMAARERAYASKQAEKGGTSLEEAGIGRGYFFKRALGSSFGGDRIARTRGRFETDPGPGRDPSGSQASRFRGGFDYGVSNTIKSPTKGALASIIGSRPGGPGGFLGAGAQAINPEVLGGELAKYQGTRKNAAGFSVDTTATQVQDIVGVLNQIGQLIVRTSNSTIQAVDGVQRVNVKVVESVQSLGQLQVAIAERALDQQRMLAGAAEDHQEKMLARQLSAAEKGQFTPDDFSGNLTAEKGYGFGGKGGGILGGLFGGSGIGDILGTGLNLFGGGRRGGVRTNRFGVKTKTDATGFNFRYKGRKFASGTGDTLTNARIAKGGAFNPVKAENDIMQRYTKRYGERAAVKRFGAEALGDAGVKLGKSGMLSRFLRPVFKRIPIFGGLIDFAVSLALGEPIGRAAAKAVGATLGAGLGSLIPVPGVGTIAGGILGDFAGGAIYDAVAGGGGGSTEGVTPFASGGIVTKPTTGLVGEAGTEGVFPLEGKKGKETFIKFGEGILEAQRRNRNKFVKLQAAGLEQYYEKEDGWTTGWKKFTDWIKSLGGQLAKWMFGNGDQTNDNSFDIPDGVNNPSAMPENSNYTGEVTGNTFNPLPGGVAGKQKGQAFGDKRSYGGHSGIDITETKRADSRAPVIAYKTGTVTKVATSGGNPGGLVNIKHADGMVTSYRHITPRSGLKVGDTVGGGQHIGNLFKYNVGQTEMTHLHFEVYDKDGKLLNPTRFVNEAKNNIGDPLSDARAAEVAGIQTTPITPETPSGITPQQVTPLPAGLSADPVGTPRPQGELVEKIMGKRSTLLDTMRKFEDQTKNATIFDKRDGKSKGEKLTIPGVGSIVKDKKLFGGWFNKYFNLSGEQITVQEFAELIKKQRAINQKELEQKNEALGLDPSNTTKDPWASASADTGNGVLQASAMISAGDRALSSTPAVVNLPMEQKSSGGGNQTLMASSLAGTPASSMTPGWVLNSVLS